MTSDRLRRLGWRGPDEPATRVARAQDVPAGEPVTVRVRLPASFRAGRAASPPVAPAKPARASAPARRATRSQAATLVARLRSAGLDTRLTRSGITVPPGQRDRALRELEGRR